MLNIGKRTNDYNTMARQNGEQIKTITEELEKLVLPENPAQNEIDTYVSKINSMKEQVGELYNQLKGLNYNVKSKDYDGFYFAFKSFNQLAQQKLDAARDISPQE